MKLLVKIFLENLNKYDLDQIVNIVKMTKSNKDTEVHIVTDNIYLGENIFCYNLNTKSIPEIINYRIDKSRWDILLLITKPSLTVSGFDNLITETYKNIFPNLDGVLSLNNGTKHHNDNTIEFPVIGRNYYNKFNYIYNPSYYRKNYDLEFYEIVKQKEKLHFIEDVYLKPVLLKCEDDNIYDMRIKYNFGL